jgi:thiol-disulfide isomerase/thioredoxin
MKYIFLLAFALTLTGKAFAQQGGYQLGQPVKDFTILADYGSMKAVAVIFMNPNCPNSRLYETRLSNLASAYKAKGVNFIFINAPISMQDAGEASDKAAANSTLNMLADSDQKLSKQFGATRTPEAFVLHNVNGSFVLKYKGAIDDNPQLEASVKEAYLRNALDAVVANRAVPVAEKRAVGCMVKRF